ncbi:CTL-like protein DDB_G0269978 [Hondaea fermentalgiana]|uniref:Choline transporter-like protein n=1 Tax=Hondaea fermentalgiana TaxID=2315210 RepID=A0A2R5GMW2_9STRA|nr:CTL-like protein DDB_G0269978 [Hondaea fermentalgiana]|eukprot:GBG32230.1 CTL-like protein DDB_G0269978 [Hondaea fermentalgiana]
MDETLVNSLRSGGSFTAGQGLDSGSEDESDDLDREPVDLDRELASHSGSDSSGRVVDLDDFSAEDHSRLKPALRPAEQDYGQAASSRFESKGKEVENRGGRSARRVSFADDVVLNERQPPRGPSPMPSDSSVSSVESDEIDGLFSMGAEPLQMQSPDLDREYRRITAGNLHTNELTYVSRVSLFRDRSYATAFAVCILGVLAFGLATYRVENKHHYIATLVVGLCLTGTASACMVGLHYKLFRGQWQQAASTPFSLQYLKLIAPLEGSLLVAVLVIIWAKGWSWMAGLGVAWTAAYDLYSLQRVDDGTQFAAVLLEMASDMVVDNEEMRPAVRRAWMIFMGLNVWLAIWISIFVDTASSTAYHSKAILIFLMFSLYWTTQVARSLLSYYVTGAVVYRLVLSDRDGRQPGKVQATILQRSLTVGFGSICAGGLYINMAIGLAAAHDSLRHLCRWKPGRSSRSGHGTWRAGSSVFNEGRRGSITSLGDDRTDDGNGTDEENSSTSIWAEEEMRAASHGGPMYSANRYAWARVSLRGAPFRSASREAWAKLVSTGVIGAVQTETADRLLSSWVTIFGCLTAICANLLLPDITRQTSEIQFEFFVASFVAGASSAAVLLEPLRASVAAIYIAFAENPKCFAKTWPIVHHRLMRTSEMALFSAASSGTSPTSPMDDETSGEPATANTHVPLDQV